jgi:hypothetical protein
MDTIGGNARGFADVQDGIHRASPLGKIENLVQRQIGIQVGGRQFVRSLGEDRQGLFARLLRWLHPTLLQDPLLLVVIAPLESLPPIVLAALVVALFALGLVPLVGFGALGRGSGFRGNGISGFLGMAHRANEVNQHCNVLPDGTNGGEKPTEQRF